jgi:hypothetical protein
MQTSQGYIFCILQHFATKFCNFTDFNKFFTGIYFFSPKLKISLTCKLSNRFYSREIRQKVKNPHCLRLRMRFHSKCIIYSLTTTTSSTAPVPLIKDNLSKITTCAINKIDRLFASLSQWRNFVL